MGLKPGMVVKDEAGVLKVVTRIGANTVSWRYLDESIEPEEREHSSQYAKFADTHYITPRTAPIHKAA
jgi:hypothetical protein